MSDAHAHSVGFVRRSAIPPAPPPAAASGPLKWIRENLFNGWLGTLLTLLALAAIWYVLSGIVPWILNGVWTADSIRECREILGETRGGCFAVIAERWHQLIFGRYPQNAYWRPVLAFLLLAVAVAPVLFQQTPKKLLWFTGLYPFVAYWLIWGGTIWVPATALLGVVAGYAAYRAVVDRSFALGIGAGIVAAVLVWGLIGPLLVSVLAGIVPLDLYAVQSRDIGGFMLNFILGTVCVSLSLPLGIALALGRQSNLPIIKFICVAFIEFIRGVPLITLLFVANVVLAYFLPPQSNFDLILRVIIMITLFASAYIAEVIRGGLAALPRGQYEAGDSLGLDYWTSMRLIVLPQALKISIPGITNVAIGLFKDTTLVSVISMFDMVGMIRGPLLTATDWSGVYWELFGFAAVLFFLVCYPISQYSQWLERQLATDRH
jgi:general L-amino acid transport system permease protein